MTSGEHQNIPRAAIVTVSYNSGRFLAQFLESTNKVSVSVGAVPVVVADNCSEDMNAVAETTEAHGAKFVGLDSNRGYGGAVNEAIRHIDPRIPWVLVSNPDVVMEPGSLDALLEIAEADNRIGAVGPAIIEPDGSVYPSARRLPSLRTGLGHALFADLWPANPWTRAYHRDGEHGERRTTGWLSGACLLVRRSAFDSLKGFDEGFFMYFEDVDLGYRLSRAGWTNVYEPHARVMHVGAHSTQNSSRHMRMVHHQSAYRFLSRKYSRWYMLPLRTVLRIGLAVRARARALTRP